MISTQKVASIRSREEEEEEKGRTGPTTLCSAVDSPNPTGHEHLDPHLISQRHRPSHRRPPIQTSRDGHRQIPLRYFDARPRYFGVGESGEFGVGEADVDAAVEEGDGGWDDGVV